MRTRAQRIAIDRHGLFRGRVIAAITTSWPIDEAMTFALKEAYPPWRLVRVYRAEAELLALFTLEG